MILNRFKKKKKKLVGAAESWIENVEKLTD